MHLLCVLRARAVPRAGGDVAARWPAFSPAAPASCQTRGRRRCGHESNDHQSFVISLCRPSTAWNPRRFRRLPFGTTYIGPRPSPSLAWVQLSCSSASTAIPARIGLRRSWWPPGARPETAAAASCESAGARSAACPRFVRRIRRGNPEHCGTLRRAMRELGNAVRNQRMALAVARGCPVTEESTAYVVGADRRLAFG